MKLPPSAFLETVAIIEELVDVPAMLCSWCCATAARTDDGRRATSGRALRRSGRATAATSTSTLSASVSLSLSVRSSADAWDAASDSPSEADTGGELGMRW
jgi:hypothetical protein